MPFLWYRVAEVILLQVAYPQKMSLLAAASGSLVHAGYLKQFRYR